MHGEEKPGPIVRRFYVVINALVVAVMTLGVPYLALVEVEMLLLSLNVMLFLGAFVYLRWSQPLLARPFRIPVRTETVCTSQSCMVSNLRIIWKLMI